MNRKKNEHKNRIERQKSTQVDWVEKKPVYLYIVIPDTLYLVYFNELAILRAAVESPGPDNACRMPSLTQINKYPSSIL